MDSMKKFKKKQLKLNLQFFGSNRGAEIDERLAAISADIEARSSELTTDQIDAYETEVGLLQEERTMLIQNNEKRKKLLSSISSNSAGANTLAQFSSAGGGSGEQRSNEETDHYDTPEYRNAFMQFCIDGTPIPQELRATTTTTDAAAAIPTTLLNEIVKEMKSYGGVLADVRTLNIKGGVSVPILSLKPTAKWISEGVKTDSQKVTAKDSVVFNYYGLEVKIAQTLLANVTTFSAFQEQFIPLAVEAMNQAMEIAIFNGTGTGSPLGVTKDNRVKAAQKITLSSAEFTEWAEWKKKVFAKIPLAYRRGNFYMAAGTFDGYIDGMVDATGQPIGRVNYGISDEPTQRFGGKNVKLVENDVVTAYDDAADGDVVAVFMNPKDYAINSNMEMQVIRWTDHDTNEVKDKAILVCDGKLIDASGVIIVIKGA